MKLRTVTLAAIALAGVAQFSPAFAQKVFVINESVILRDSKIGKEIVAKLGQVQQAGVTQLGLKELSDKIKAEDEALKPLIQSLTPEALNANATLKARVEAQGRLKNEYLQKTDALYSQMDRQGDSANVAFEIALAPAVDFVAKEAGADIVLRDSPAVFVKPSADLSAKVVARLDATLPTLAALQASLPQQPAPGTN